jgi:hypothetical protein
MDKPHGKALSIKRGLVALLALLLSFSVAWADQDQGMATVYAVGASHIKGADVLAGRNDAIADSLVMAVIQELNNMMPPQTMEGHFQELSQVILPRTDQFVADYKMLTEATYGSTHRVMVKVTVSVRRLKEALNQAGIYIGSRPYPHVLYCIAEKLIGDMGYQYWWSGQPRQREDVATDTITTMAKGKGFIVTSPPMGQAMQAYPPELSAAEAVALGQQLQADVVVVGQAVANETPNTMGASRSFRGDVTLNAYSVRNGRQIGHSQQVAAVTGDDPDAGGRQAVADAARAAGQAVTAQIAQAWFATGAGGAQIEVYVEGIGGHIADFVKLRGALSTISGVDKVQRKEMQSDAAVLLVAYQGSARALADSLMRQSFDTFGLNIAEPEGNTIHLKIVPR